MMVCVMMCVWMGMRGVGGWSYTARRYLARQQNATAFFDLFRQMFGDVRVIVVNIADQGSQKASRLQPVP